MAERGAVRAAAVARTVKGRAAAWLAVSTLLVVPHASCRAQQHYGFGRPAGAAEIAAWDSDIAPGGENLPSGSGTVAHGAEVYAVHCAACHGAKGEGGLGDRLVGGKGTLASAAPVKTVGSYWPYATTLFDYIRRAMPFNAPHSLSDADVYAVSGYVLNLNGLMPGDATVDAHTLAAVKMPNRDGFVEDPRPDIRMPECMADCAAR